MVYRPLLCAIAALSVSAAASAQSAAPSFGYKLGLSQGDSIGLYGGVDFKLPSLPIRLDADAWSAFQDFGDRSAGYALTANYVKSLPAIYYGAGVGYARARERNNDFDTVAVKFLVGGKIPFAGAGLEGSLIWTQHSIGQVHTIGTVSLVWRT